MKLKSTPSATKVIFDNPQIHIPNSTEECLGGINSIVGLNTPDLYDQIDYFDRLISEIKQSSLSKHITNLIQDSTDCLTALDITFRYLIANTSVTLITTEDEGKYVDVRNIFKLRKNLAAEDQEKVKGPENGVENLLGVYMPRTGSVLLWVDKIIQKDNPELIFQKVLLHELIHALYDVKPRRFDENGISILGSIDSVNDDNNEETLDNLLVLHIYEPYSEASDIIKEFIAGQPFCYKDSLNKVDDDFGKEITQHLSRKVENNTVNTNIHPKFYLINEDQISEEEYFMSWSYDVYGRLSDLNFDPYTEKSVFRTICWYYSDCRTIGNCVRFKIDEHKRKVFLTVGEAYLFLFDCDKNKWSLYELQGYSEISAPLKIEDRHLYNLIKHCLKTIDLDGEDLITT